LKLDLRTGSSNSNVHCDMDYIPGAESETGSESVITRIGVPLAGPVNVSGQEIYRYSADYTEPSFPPKVSLTTRFPPRSNDFPAGRPKQQRLRAIRGLLPRLQPPHDAAAHLVVAGPRPREPPVDAPPAELAASAPDPRVGSEPPSERPVRHPPGDDAEHPERGAAGHGLHRPALQRHLRQPLLAEPQRGAAHPQHGQPRGHPGAAAVLEGQLADSQF
jgi:hypothetical protein